MMSAADEIYDRTPWYKTSSYDGLRRCRKLEGRGVGESQQSWDNSPYNTTIDTRELERSVNALEELLK